MTSKNYLHPMTEAILSEMTPLEAHKRLVEGNKRFLKKVDGGHEKERDLRKFIDSTSEKGQFPFAIVLSCIDSRMPTETLFDQSIGDIFNTRIAGNFVNVDILGGMEFACTRANQNGDSIGVKLVLVLGHTSCGAISGAFRYVYPGCFSTANDEGGDGGPALHNLIPMLDNLTPAIKTTPLESGQCGDRGYQKNFVDRAAEKNVALTMNNILIQSKDVRDLVNDGKLIIKGAMYDVSTGIVRFLDDKHDIA